MRFRPRTWFLLSLLLFAAAYWTWTYGDKLSATRRAQAAQSAAVQPPGPGLAKIAEARNSPKSKTYRLSNTRQTEKQLLRSNHAIILRNALIDTQFPLKLDIPAHLRANGAPGSYIVQSDGPMDQRIYDRLKQLGVAYVSYIPNNAALVQATPDQAREMAGDAMFQAVLPYEPYYKLATDLLPAAVAQQPPPSGALNVTTFPGQRDALLAALQALGAQFMGEERSPFGPTLTVMVPPENLAAVAQLPLAQEIEPYAPRRMLNDLTRAAMGVATNTLYTTPNYLNLSGSNVTVNLNDSGVDKTHPDFQGPGGAVRLQGAANALFDYEGHGTHVAGIIMGNGSKSTTFKTNVVPGSIIPGAGFQGKATNANLFVQSLGLVIGTTIAAAYQEGGTFVSDASLQTNASVELGTTNLISNNSWGYDGVNSYDMHAASFDQATRDAQPGVPGEQPLLFVFAAGDGGNGNNNGGGGAESSIVSPATAKNVITVGAIDSLRNITNGVTFDDVSTNQIFLPWTDNTNLVAWFSSCGNVSPGTEGLSGRYKPDVVAPGVFTISCRATNYVDPAYATQVTPYPFPGQIVEPGKVNNYVLPIVPSNFPGDTEELIIEATPNSQSPVPFPPLLILGAPSGQALTVLGTNIVQPQAQGITNFVIVTTNLDGQAWNFGVSTTNGQIQPVSYDLTFFLVETNDLGVSITNAHGYYHVISNLNSALKPYYMYQYGTSMSAGAVSGLLALMQEFLQTQPQLNATNPAPALLKAMLINGSRSINQQYDFNTQLAGSQPPSGPNEQGWGLPYLPNILPSSLTNVNGGNTSMLLVNQSTNDALATGQWESYTINGDTNATGFPMRVTLVWTDPPGNPTAGIALVNNLDLLVTDGTGTNIWLGNDFLSGSIFTTNNSGDAPDFINNVQNVYIDSTNAPFQFPLTVTVLGSRVNVNAVTTQTNQIAQDYALVISSDDSALNKPLTITSSGISSGKLSLLSPFTGKTNANGSPLLTWPLTGFVQGNSNLVTIASNAVPLLNQRVGANEPNLYANGGLYTGTDTNGNPAQWHFFVYTNNQHSSTNNATNVAFATFLPPDLATQIAPRTNGADIDLYVSTNPGLTNLDPAVFAAMKPSDMSLSRSGTETVIYSNSQPNEVYYIGVKSEDQQGADFDFYAIAQQTNFGNLNPDGSITYTYSGPPVTIPDDQFGAPPAQVLAIATRATLGRNIRKVTVSLTIDHANPGDLYGVLQPDQATQVVLNNFSGPNVFELFTNTYNDLDDGFGGAHSDGPGSLENYMSQTIPPLWLLEEMDDAAFQGGVITAFSVTVYPQPLLGPVVITLPPGTAYLGYVNVPTDAIYLTNTVTLQNGSGNASLGIYMTNELPVTQTDLDGTNITFTAGGGLQTPGGYLLVTTNSPLPLSGGIWYYGIFNNGSTTNTFTNQIFFGYNFVPNLVQTLTNTVPLSLATDGTTNSTQICITGGQQVLDLSVGLRLDDPDLDDLVIQLTSPQGTSLILFENRGGVLATNLGITLSSSVATNYVYTTFTEDTNLTDVPIKFAPPPYATNIYNPLIVLVSNNFEYFTNSQGVFNYGAGTYTNGELVNGWFVETNLLELVNVLTNRVTGTGTNQVTNLVTIQVTNQVFNEVTVMTDSQFDYDDSDYLGSNYLALAWGRLSQTFKTVPGVAYELRYYARSPGLTDWWPADDDVVNIIGTNKATTTNVTFDVGEVERAFTFTNVNGFTNSWAWFDTNVGNFGTNDFTVDFWIKSADTNESAVFEKRPACSDNQSFFSIRMNVPAAIGSGTWTNTGSMSTARYNHTATLLNNGLVLDAGGFGNGSYQTSSELYYPATGTWSNTGSLNTDRVTQEAVLLPNGVALTAGGQSDTPVNPTTLASAELYNPSTQTWVNTGPMNIAREYFTLTLLTNDLVLATGGANVDNSPATLLSSAELYYPTTGTWSNISSMNAIRYNHSATLLPNGQVLVAGGDNASGVLASAELYNPATGTWTTTGSLHAARVAHTATLLPNGLVLVAGGQGQTSSGSSVLASAELYYPAAGTWSNTGPLNIARVGHSATLLPGGLVLVAGGTGLPFGPQGNNSDMFSSAEVYDQATGTWTLTASMQNARYGHTATLLPDGQVLVSAGRSTNGELTSAELYDATAVGGIVYEQGSANDINYLQVKSTTNVDNGIYHHVAVTRQGQLVSLYIDGVLNAANIVNSGIANISNNVQLIAGKSVCDGIDGTQPFAGDLDEQDLWNRALTPAEIHAIYAAGSSGKYSTNSLYPNFRITFDSVSTNTVILTNFTETNWVAYTNSFIAVSNQTTIELAGNPLGVLLDDLVLVQLPYTNYNNYYLPEEPLTPFLGENPQGCWTLSIWDTRQNVAQATNGTLLAWTLQLTTSSTNVNLIVLTNRVPYNQPKTNGIIYFGVDVPATANYATNILFNASGPMNLYFNQNALPTGGLPGDVTLVTLTGSEEAGTNTVATQGAPPPLIPGQRYFLGVQDTGSGKESFSLQVNFDVSANTNIIALTNSISMTTNIGTNGPQFYSFLVPTNAILVTFQLLDPTNGEANLYAREGLPVPYPLSFDYESLNEGTNDQFIAITTNSLPVPLQTVNTNDVLPQPPQTWYLSVYNPGTNTVGYTILATYVTTNDLLIRDLNKYANYTYRALKPAAPPGFPANVMYSFTVTNTNAVAVQFTVTNISLNGDLQLLVQDGAFPTPDDFYIGSFNPGTNDQFVSIVTNASLISLSNVWYAAVPNVSTNNAAVRYSITAAILTNGPVRPVPLFIGASISSPSSGFTMYWSAAAGATYQIQVSTNLTSWSVATNITAQSNTAAYTDAVPVSSQKSRFFRIVAP
jgi:subtilisin-like proprotein convertase family protein